MTGTRRACRVRVMMDRALEWKTGVDAEEDDDNQRRRAILRTDSTPGLYILHTNAHNPYVQAVGLACSTDSNILVYDIDQSGRPGLAISGLTSFPNLDDDARPTPALATATTLHATRSRAKSLQYLSPGRSALKEQRHTVHFTAVALPHDRVSQYPPKTEDSAPIRSTAIVPNLRIRRQSSFRLTRSAAPLSISYLIGPC